jgi:hypothetical protein
VRLIVTGTDVEIDDRYETPPLLGAACTVASKGSEP